MSDSENWGALVIEGLKEAIAFERGELPDVRVVRYVRAEDGTFERIESRGSDLRDGWEEEFRRIAGRGDDRLLDDPSSTSTWDDEEWEWPEDP